MQHPPARVRSAVACEYHGCHNAAAMVQLLPGPGPQGTLVVDGFADAERADHDLTAQVAGAGHAAPLYDATLASQVRSAGPDLATALFDRDPAWAPFFCPTCERAYCADHWRADRCPFGHRQY
ncbi:MAG: hypothetical protein WCA46_03890 [Actinocatenispora sp.]